MLKGYLNRVTTIAFLPDSKTLASASHNKTVKLWDARSGAILQTLKGYLDFVATMAFSPDSKTLALALINKTIKL